MVFRLTWVSLVAFLAGLICTITAKPLQNGNSEQAPVRRLDTLSGFTMGSNKATRSLPDFPRGSLDNLGDGNYLRSLDSIGGSNYLRSLDSIGSGNILRDLDSLGGGNILRALDSLGGGNVLRQAPGNNGGFDFRSLDSLGGGNLIRSMPSSSGSNARAGKRLDTLSGLTLGHQKRTFDEVDRTAFDGFNKRNFDEIDRVGFDGFSKREARSVRAPAVDSS